MKRLIFLMCTLFLMGGVSVLAQDVRYNFAQDEDFSKYQTYKWVDLKGVDHASELRETQIKAAIEANLATKGLQ
jgi:Domain of unknown function (DUF4136)